MKILRFEDVIAWQKGQTLGVDIYNSFRELKDCAFKDQICRAAVSVFNNIAEGFDRSSDADFVRFLYYAAGSCSEVRSMLYLPISLAYIKKDQGTLLIEKSNEMSRIIRGLIKSLGHVK